MRGRSAALGVVLALVLAVACGDDGSGSAGSDAASPRASTTPSSSTPTVPVDDTAGIEARLIEQVRQKTSGLAVGAADCPEGAPRGEQGATATCTVQVEGVEVPFTITLLADNPQSQGGAHNYQVELARPLVNVNDLVGQIRTEAAAQLKVAPEGLRVDCGAAKVMVLDVGGTIPCTIASGSTTRRLVATVTDATGSVRIAEV